MTCNQTFHRRVRLGERELVFGGEYLQPIADSRADEPIAVLRQRLQTEGYLCLRGILPREVVLAARRVVYDQLAADEALDQTSTLAHPRGAARSYMGQRHVTHHPDFLAMCEHPHLFAFFDALFAEPSRSFDYKWARTVPPGAAGTQAHMDVVYMGRGSDRLHTCWIPVGDVPLENGPMTVLPTSHRHEATARIRATYGQMDVDRDGVQGGWFTRDYLELSQLVQHPWVAGDFAAGDVVVMGTQLMHGSIANGLDDLRFTVDTRFQPAADAIDDRWVGTEPTAHRDWWRKQQEGACITIEEARANWRV